MQKITIADGTKGKNPASAFAISTSKVMGESASVIRRGTTCNELPAGPPVDQPVIDVLEELAFAASKSVDMAIPQPGRGRLVHVAFEALVNLMPKSMQLHAEVTYLNHNLEPRHGARGSSPIKVEFSRSLS